MPIRTHPTRTAAGAYLALAFLALFWGYSWVAVKVATHDAPAFTVAAMRAGLGAVTLLAFLAATRRSLRPTPFVPTAIYGLLQTTGFTLLQTMAVSMAGAGKVAILAYTMPFWLALLARLFLGERIAGARRVALALAGAGLGFIVWPLDVRSAPANALAVLAGLVWAASAVWVIRAQRADPRDLLSLTTWQMVLGAVPLVAIALAAPGEVRWTGALVASIAFLAVVATAAGWALWLLVLSRLPPAVAGVASLATPVVGVTLAAVQLGEIPSRAELAGIACVVAALVVNARAGVRRGNAPDEAARGAADGRARPK